MTIEIQCWQMVEASKPLQRSSRVFDPSSLEGDRVLVEVAGCGVCHTDLGFFYDGVRTRHELPLTLGHEISAIFIGIGGVGTFGVQLAHSMGAHVVAIDVDEDRLRAVASHGAELCLVSGEDLRATKKSIREWVKSNGYRAWGWKIFETSGHPGGQTLAFSLLGYDGHLGVVGYTRDKIEFRMSNLMAFDASMRGTWGCLPEHYPAVVERVLDGAVRLDGFVEKRPMSEINEVFEAVRSHQLKRRPILVPDFE